MRSTWARNLPYCKENNKLKTVTPMRELKIFCNHIYAGLLTEHSKQEYTFCYDDGYFINPSLPAISLTLSKSHQSYTSQYLFPFFTNLLPEGANKKIFCRLCKINEEDYFSILSALEIKDMLRS